MQQTVVQPLTMVIVIAMVFGGNKEYLIAILGNCFPQHLQVIIQICNSSSLPINRAKQRHGSTPPKYLTQICTGLVTFWGSGKKLIQNVLKQR